MYLIDEIAQSIVSSFNTEDDAKLKEGVNKMLRFVNNYEADFAVVKRPYLIAKSLYLMLTVDDISEDDQVAIIKLTYFCLLDNYLKNMDKKPSDEGYEDLVSGCKLALVLINMQHQLIMYHIIAGMANYINPQTHIRNQILLFGGIVKEAVNLNCDSTVEDIINKYYKDIYQQISSQMPVGRDLSVVKDECTPVIKNIRFGIRDTFKERDGLF